MQGQAARSMSFSYIIYTPHVIIFTKIHILQQNVYYIDLTPVIYNIRLSLKYTLTQQENKLRVLNETFSLPSLLEF